MSTLSRKARSIVVRGQKYRWMISSKKWGSGNLAGNSQEHLIVTWQAGSGATAQASLFSKVYYAMNEYDQEHGTHKAALKPSDIQKLIEHSLANGWSPYVFKASAAHKVHGPLDLSDYELPAAF